MEQLPCYSSSMSPPTYEASVAAEHDESIWPRNYRRQTPRINVAKFYHNLLLSSPHQDDDDDDNDQNKYDCLTEVEEMEGTFPPSPPSSPALVPFSSVSLLQPSASSPSLATGLHEQLLLPSSSSSSPTPKTSSLFSLLDHHHQHTITELNRLLLQTWSDANSSVPSYEAFKAKVNSHDLRPIPNTFR